jgi:hypothetical protein
VIYFAPASGPSYQEWARAAASISHDLKAAGMAEVFRYLDPRVQTMCASVGVPMAYRRAF